MQGILVFGVNTGRLHVCMSRAMMVNVISFCHLNSTTCSQYLINHHNIAPIMLCLGIEGSANKVGVGIVRDDGTILANPRKTYVRIRVKKPNQSTIAMSPPSYTGL